MADLQARGRSKKV